MSDWEILGIAPTKDEDEVRRAYMTELPKHHPEEDPEGFAKLREAYENVLRELKKQEEDEQGESEVDDTPTGRWMEKVKACYEDYPSRISEAAWDELLEDEVCYQLDEAELASEKLLVYLMDHFRLPQVIWQKLDHTFHWEENHEALYRDFPTDFIHFVRNSITGEDKIQFDQVKVGLGVESEKVDEWIRDYIYLIRYYNDDDYENINKYLEMMSDYDIYHPKLEMIRMFYLAHTGNEAEAIEIGKRYVEEHPDVEDGYYAVGEVFLQAGEAEEGIRLLNQFLEDNPYHFYTHLDLVEYYIGHPEKIMEVEESVNILGQYYGNDERVNKLLQEAYPLLIEYYEANVDLSDQEKKYTLACYYRGINDLDTCEKLCHEILQETPDNGKIYYLLSKVCVGRNDLEKAIEYNNAWIEHAEEEELLIAYEKRGLLYNYLGRYEEAIEDFDRVLETNNENLSVHVKKLYSLDHLERYEELAECAQSLVDQNYEETVLYYYLAQGRFMTGKYNDAMDACRETLRLNPYEEEAYVIETKIYYNVDQYEDALSVIDTAKSFGIEKNEDLLYYEALTLRMTEETDKALEVCKVLLEAYPESDKGFYLYARIKNESKEYEESLEKLNESIRLKPMAFKYRARSDVHENLGQYEEAIEDYKLEIAALKEEGYEDEAAADSYNNMGYTYWRYLHDEENAYACYMKAIEYNPKQNHVYNNLAEYHERRKEYEEAIKAYTKQIELEPEDDYYYVGRGWNYIYVGDYEKAKADFNKALEYNAENAYAMNGLGSIYKRQYEFEKAIPYFQKAIEMNDECMIAYENLGNSFNNLDRYKEAIEVYTAAIEKCPEREYYYLDRGDMHRYLKEYDEAFADYKRAEEVDSSNYNIYYDRGLAYIELDETEKAIECYKKVVEMYPGHAPSYCELGDAYESMGENEEAIKWYLRGIEADDTYCRSFNNLGALYYKINHIDEAMDVYKKALEIDPDYRWSLEGMGECYMAIKEYDKAIASFKKAIEVYPKYVLAYKMLGECYDNIRRYDEAIAILEKTVEMDPEYLAARNQLGFTYLNAERFKEAIKCFKAIIEIEENYAPAYRGLGIVYERKKAYRKAYEYHVKAATLAPGSGIFSCEVQDVCIKHLKNYKKTLSILQGLLEHERVSCRTYGYTANVLKAMGKKEGINELYEKTIQSLMWVVDKGYANACTYYFIGDFYREMGEEQKAEEYLLLAIEYSKKCAECNEVECYEGHNSLGNLYESQGQYSKALEHYKMAASLNLEEEEYKKSIKRMEKKLKWSRK